VYVLSVPVSSTVQARYAAGVREIPTNYFDSKPQRDMYLIAQVCACPKKMMLWLFVVLVVEN
jgi:hypothetical protein